MPRILTDTEIGQLIAETKPLPPGCADDIRMRDKPGHKLYDLSVVGADGDRFVLMMRQATENPLNFSVILAYQPEDTNERVLLRRYNGKSHKHTNHIEGERLPYDFHIHSATQRYMRRSGTDNVGYAEVTDRYSDVWGALDCLMSDCGFVVPPGQGFQFQQPNGES